MIRIHTQQHVKKRKARHHMDSIDCNSTYGFVSTIARDHGNDTLILQIYR
jgi:hypothetical protein